jgi:hypothetical protein
MYCASLFFMAGLSMINCDQLACALEGSQEVTTLELTGWAGTRVEDGPGCENSHLRPKTMLIYILVTVLNNDMDPVKDAIFYLT